MCCISGVVRQLYTRQEVLRPTPTDWKRWGCLRQLFFPMETLYNRDKAYFLVVYRGYVLSHLKIMCQCIRPPKSAPSCSTATHLYQISNHLLHLY